ncbi:rna-binding protein [Stylonychia lemnae]|uniref:Rna-binding protein n=1 Tax=Stylonychia lemnae TaxID=5949 RepID=A0A078B4F8_STYLE|nr:rna-binding protein [Stylonychia lemnae]|eukprot:CDW88102.1 rna-binding protein [Stylonychia lemnae]
MLSQENSSVSITNNQQQQQPISQISSQNSFTNYQPQPTPNASAQAERQTASLQVIQTHNQIPFAEFKINDLDTKLQQNLNVIQIESEKPSTQILLINHDKNEFTQPETNPITSSISNCQPSSLQEHKDILPCTVQKTSNITETHQVIEKEKVVAYQDPFITTALQSDGFKDFDSSSNMILNEDQVGRLDNQHKRNSSNEKEPLREKKNSQNIHQRIILVNRDNNRKNSSENKSQNNRNRLSRERKFKSRSRSPLLNNRCLNCNCHIRDRQQRNERDGYNNRQNRDDNYNNNDRKRNQFQNQNYNMNGNNNRSNYNNNNRGDFQQNIRSRSIEGSCSRRNNPSLLDDRYNNNNNYRDMRDGRNRNNGNGNNYGDGLYHNNNRDNQRYQNKNFDNQRDQEKLLHIIVNPNKDKVHDDNNRGGGGYYRNYNSGFNNRRDDDGKQRKDSYSREKDSPQQRHNPENPGNNVYVAGIPRRITEEDLRRVFVKFGPISEIKVIRDPVTKNSKGFAYVLFDRISDAQRAIENLDNAKVFNDWALKVERAKRALPYEPKNDNQNEDSFHEQEDEETDILPKINNNYNRRNNNNHHDNPNHQNRGRGGYQNDNNGEGRIYDNNNHQRQRHQQSRSRSYENRRKNESRGVEGSGYRRDYHNNGGNRNNNNDGNNNHHQQHHNDNRYNRKYNNNHKAF